MPIIQQMGLSPIWFGILVRAMESVCASADRNESVRHSRIMRCLHRTHFRGVVPFLAADFVHLLLLIFVPALVLALPKALGQ